MDAALGRLVDWRKMCAGVAVMLGLGMQSAAAALLVHTEQASYEISPGAELDIRVYLDADDATPGVQSLAQGLFSYGVKLEFDPAKLSLSGPDAIGVPDALNFHGFDPGASRQLGSGFAGVQGNVDPVMFEPYGGSLLATFRVKDIGGGGAYEVMLAPHRLVASEQLFVDGAGTVLDAGMQFASAQILAVPEPSIAGMFLAGLSVLGYGALRRRRA